MNSYDLVFVGHVTIDDIEASEGTSSGVPGGRHFSEPLQQYHRRRKLPSSQKWPGRMNIYWQL